MQINERIRIGTVRNGYVIMVKDDNDKWQSIVFEEKDNVDGAIKCRLELLEYIFDDLSLNNTFSYDEQPKKIISIGLRKNTQ